MGTLLGSLLIRLGLDRADFTAGLSASEKELKAATRRIARVGKEMGDLGQKLSLAVSVPLAALAASSVKAALESKAALGQVDAALASMGNAAGRTRDQLEALAGGIMRSSLYDDDEVLRSVTANLLTFGNVAGDQFDRAQRAAVDLAARMGQDLQSATLMVGKALNDPVKGLSALSKAGIQFTDQQKTQIKAMVAAGDAAGAQKIMLAELERQFKGSAQAMRDADPVAAMKQSFGEFQEKIGAQLIKVLPVIAGAIERVLNAFNALSPGMQQAVVIAGALGAAFGPLLMGLGAVVSATAPFIAAIGTIGAGGGVLLAAKAALVGLGAALGPVLIPLAAVAAVGALFYANWDSIAPVLQKVGAVFTETLGPPLQRLIAALSDAMSGLLDGPLGPMLRTAGDVAMQFGRVFSAVFGASLIAVVKAAGMVIGTVFDTIALAVRMLTAVFDGTLARLGIDSVKRLYEGVKLWLLDKLGFVWDAVRAKIEAVKGFFFGLYDAVVGHSYVPDMVDGIAREMARLDAVMVNPAKKAAQATSEAFRKLADEVRPVLDRLFPEAAAANGRNADFGKLEAARKGGAIGADTFNAAADALANEGFADRAGSAVNDNFFGDAPLADLAAARAEIDALSQSMAAQIPQVSGLAAAFASAGLDLDGFRRDIARAFTDAVLGAENLGDALRSVFNRLASQILDNAFDNLLGSLLGGVIPGFASGTSFAPGGLALVGERGPELVELPRGSQVHTAQETRGMFGASLQSGDTYHINVTGPISRREARATGDQVAAGMQQRLAMSRRAGLAGG